MSLSNKRQITLRPVTEGDAASILEIYSPIVLTSSITYEETPPTLLEMKERITKVTAKYPWLVAIDPETLQLIGYAYASTHRERAAYRWATEVSVYIRDGFKGSGVGKRLYSELLDSLRELGYFKALAGISLPNEASVRLHESMGFKAIGTYPRIGFKFGQWHDAGWWEFDLQKSGQMPSEPLKPKAT
ncbi:MAG: arsinothricin resistance N-acetyltransferase ArsN1 family B [Bdellovibrionota bacterium]